MGPLQLSDVTEQHPEHRCNNIAAEIIIPQEPDKKNITHKVWKGQPGPGTASVGDPLETTGSIPAFTGWEASTQDRTPVHHRSHTPLTGLNGIFVLVYYEMYYSRKANWKTSIYVLYHDMKQNKDMITQSQTAHPKFMTGNLGWVISHTHLIHNTDVHSQLTFTPHLNYLYQPTIWWLV